MTLFLITLLVFGFVIFIMAIGVIAGNRRIKGSCGGLGCDFCSQENRDKCRDRLSRPDAEDNKTPDCAPCESAPRSSDGH